MDEMATVVDGIGSELLSLFPSSTALLFLTSLCECCCQIRSSDKWMIVVAAVGDNNVGTLVVYSSFV